MEEARRSRSTVALSCSGLEPGIVDNTHGTKQRVRTSGAVGVEISLQGSRKIADGYSHNALMKFHSILSRS